VCIVCLHQIPIQSNLFVFRDNDRDANQQQYKRWKVVAYAASYDVPREYEANEATLVNVK